MDPKTEVKIRSLYKALRSKRAVARKLGINVKTVRAALLGSPPPPPSPSKLAPFLPTIEAKAKDGISVTRILREIRSIGYAGGRSIVAEAVKRYRPPRKAEKKAFRRFELPPAQEAQADWSPIRVVLARREELVHLFAMILAHSRKLWARCYRDERLPSLLAGHVAAFDAFGGVPKRVVYDNMATVTLGRSAGKPIWNERFLEFTRHYAYEPFVCRPRDPNRKGRIEAAIGFIQRDAVRGQAFESLDHLNRHLAEWLSTIANVRVHGTTHETPEALFRVEKTLLTPLPSRPFATWRSEVRRVQRDCLLSYAGNFYSVPPQHVGREVVVRVFPDHLDIVDGRGALLASHRLREGRGHRVVDPAHYDAIRRASGASPSEMERRFLATFPKGEAFLAGLKAKMKGLAIVHLRFLARLAARYGAERVVSTLAEATRLRAWSAHTVARLLAKRHPDVSEKVELPLLGSAADVAATMGEVEQSSLSDILPEEPHVEEEGRTE